MHTQYPFRFQAISRTAQLLRSETAAHEVIVSDLYAMGWKAVYDAKDFPECKDSGPLNFDKASGEAYKTGTQAADIADEQRKLLWADVVILQFPMWWYGMPAILKGWVDRVFAYGFAYGVGVHGGGRWGRIDLERARCKEGVRWSR